jgi:hypothetical protein
MRVREDAIVRRDSSEGIDAVVQTPDLVVPFHLLKMAGLARQNCIGGLVGFTSVRARR